MANVSSSNGLEKRPKLRFPGFDEPYRKCRIGDVYAERSQREAGDMELLSVTMNNGVMPRSEIEGKDNSSEDKSNYKVVCKGDMVYNSMRMWQGANGVSDYDGIVSPAYTVLMPTEEIDNQYFAALFKTSNLINEFRKNSQGLTSDTWNLKYPQICAIRLSIPSLQEQHKISAFIGALEERIGKQRQLVDALKKYKRGLQNRFFFKRSQLSQKTSEIGSHEVKPLGSIVQINPKTGSLPEAFIYIDLECVEGGVLNSKKLISRNSAPSRAQRLLEKGDLIYQMVRPYQKNNYYFQKAFEYPTVASTGYAQIRCSEMDTQFIYEQLSSDYFAHEAMLRSTGTGYPAINADDLAEIPIWVPPFERQQKVGAVLSFIGAKIEANQRMLSALCRVKSSLLQQLFI